MTASWVEAYYDAIMACVARYREMATGTRSGQRRCATCDHIEADHTDRPRYHEVPPSACMRGTGLGAVCDCPGFVASSHETEAMAALLTFLDEFGPTVPLVKLSRWLGYVQGVLIAHGKTTVQVERDATRSLFRPLDFDTQPVTNESLLAVEARKLLDEWDRGKLSRSDFEIMMKELIKDA